MSSSPFYIQALNGLKHREQLLRVLLFTLVTVFIWIGFSIYFSQSQSKLDVNIRKNAEPINPNIDRETLTELGNRRHYSPEELLSFPIYERITDEEGISRLVEVGTGIVSPIEIIESDQATGSAQLEELIIEATGDTGESTIESVPEESTGEAGL